MPLDLTDEQLMASEDDLNVYKQALDEHGWSSSQTIFPSRICRAWYEMALIRDEILELTLGPPETSLQYHREFASPCTMI